MLCMEAASCMQQASAFTIVSSNQGSEEMQAPAGLQRRPHLLPSPSAYRISVPAGMRLTMASG